MVCYKWGVKRGAKPKLGISWILKGVLLGSLDQTVNLPHSQICPCDAEIQCESNIIRPVSSKGVKPAVKWKTETGAAAHFLKCSEHVLHFVVHIAFVMIIVCIFALLLLRHRKLYAVKQLQELTDDGCYEGEHRTQCWSLSRVVCRWPWPLPVSRTGGGGGSSTNSRSDHQIPVHTVFVFFTVLACMYVYKICQNIQYSYSLDIYPR